MLDRVEVAVEEVLGLDGDVCDALGGGHVERVLARRERDLRRRHDRPLRLARDTVVDLDAERAPGGLQHRLGGAGGEVFVDLELHAFDERGGGLGVDGDRHLVGGAGDHRHRGRLEQGRVVLERVGRRGDREVGRRLAEGGELVAGLVRASVERERADGEERVVRGGHVDDRDRAAGELPTVQHAVERFEGAHSERRLGDLGREPVARGDRVAAVGIGDVAHDPDVFGPGGDDARAQHRGGNVGGKAEGLDLGGVERDTGRRRGRADVVVGDRLEVALDEARGAVDGRVQPAERGEKGADDERRECSPADDGHGGYPPSAHVWTPHPAKSMGGVGDNLSICTVAAIRRPRPTVHRSGRRGEHSARAVTVGARSLGDRAVPTAEDGAGRRLRHPLASSKDFPCRT